MKSPLGKPSEQYRHGSVKHSDTVDGLDKKRYRDPKLEISNGGRGTGGPGYR